MQNSVMAAVEVLLIILIYTVPNVEKKIRKTQDFVKAVEQNWTMKDIKQTTWHKYH